MPSPSLIAAARHAPDARAQIARMAQVMRYQMEGVEECCTFVHLVQAGFTEAEIHAYRDDARAYIRGKPSANRWTAPDRVKGSLLAIKAREIRRRVNGSQWAPPVVAVIEAAHG
ncbi:hypothetical protein [Methylobacterium sp. WL120]|uniref:hypothetical protein n=1 Tax=Methylobacterium sp. WL120 TaxID=2603887 RepID=UPI0011C7F05E|nr:hypothetical protein [Methylobacterium sp. WL120]TXM65851.1 hypothetical protein FV229_14355 [Methylobacterium sp. WL120]